MIEQSRVLGGTWVYSPNTGDDEHGLPRSDLSWFFSPRLSPLSLSDLQALEHVSQPDNKPAKRGDKTDIT